MPFSQANSIRGQAIAAFRNIARWPTRLADPASRPLLIGGLGRYTVLLPGTQHRLFHQPRILALKPVVPPAQRFLQKTDSRPRQALVRVLVSPGADKSFTRYLQMLHQPQYSVGEAIGPAANGIYRTLDRRVILIRRTGCPVGAAPLMFKPGLKPQATGFHAIEPHVTPAVANDLRVRWQAIEGEHDGGLGEVVTQ